jgi:hypothetical protein
VLAQRRHQVTDIEPTSAPKVTEHVARGRVGAPCRARSSLGLCPGIPLSAPSHLAGLGM